MQHFRRVMATMLSLMLLAGIPGLEVSAEVPSVTVPYVDANGATKTAENCLPVAANMSDGWYAVTEDSRFDGRVEISGAVNLILCDGMTLRANAGIHVPQGASLTIWAQSVSNTGKLVSAAKGGQAGIGSDNSGQCGVITINGGEVSGESDEGAGIGLGNGGKTSGQVIINGGTVTAKSHYRGAGIGGSYESHLNSITITGGTVTAISNVDGRNDYNYHGAGIGGGAKGESGTITISGGSVTATSNG